MNFLDQSSSQDARPRQRSSACELVPFREISLRRVLASGQLSNLRIGAYRSATVAIKFISNSLEEDASQLERELTNRSLLHHPRLVNVMGLCSDVPPSYRARSALIMELVEWGSLFELLHGGNIRSHISRLHRDKIAVDIADGMRFLHSNGAIHRDLSSHNVLITRDARAKIANFGLRSSDCRTVDHDEVSILTRTTAWDAPEIAENCCEEGWVADFSVDVYSCGVILWELLTSREPFKGKSFYDLLHLEDRTLAIPSELRSQFPVKVDIIENCLGPVSIRKTFDDVYRDLEAVPSTERYMNSFICPITLLPMEDPVVTSDGYTYERKGIERWLTDSGKSPYTNELLPNKTLTPNRQLKDAMQEVYSRI
jgi:serine/threonine protein kinase